MATQMNLTEYAKKADVSQPAVSYRVNNNLPLPGVQQYKKFGRFFVLDIKDRVDWKKVNKAFKQMDAEIKAPAKLSRKKAA